MIGRTVWSYLAESMTGGYVVVGDTMVWEAEELPRAYTTEPA
jgi:hypothetical protein